LQGKIILILSMKVNGYVREAEEEEEEEDLDMM
jgi:hypothetical protein